ncbi:MAG: hypothetical protein V4440_10820 [Pseudomonadota bacterium]
MMKSIFNLIFNKNTKSTFQNAGGMSQASRISQDEPQFSIFDHALMNDDYQVAEISFDEFKSSAVKVERRKFPRKPGETRSTYSTKQ